MIYRLSARLNPITLCYIVFMYQVCLFSSCVVWWRVYVYCFRNNSCNPFYMFHITTVHTWFTATILKLSILTLSGLCFVKHEINYRYYVVGTHSGSKDNGIFQMNNKYPCGNPKGTSFFTCWRVNTYGCTDFCTCKHNFSI